LPLYGRSAFYAVAHFLRLLPVATNTDTVTITPGNTFVFMPRSCRGVAPALSPLPYDVGRLRLHPLLLTGVLAFISHIRLPYTFCAFPRPLFGEFSVTGHTHALAAGDTLTAPCTERLRGLAALTVRFYAALSTIHSTPAATILFAYRCLQFTCVCTHDTGDRSFCRLPPRTRCGSSVRSTRRSLDV